MTEKIKVYGNQHVNGIVTISGAKNAALPILAASLLSSEGLYLTNIPPLSDVSTMINLLETLGVSCITKKNTAYARTVICKTDAISNFTAPYDIVKKMRASILVLGPLLARCGQCSVSLPGGCAIGVRPIDLHIEGMKALGANISLENGYVHATAPRGLRGTEFAFPIVSVTGTENLIMAATLAEGTTILHNAAKEPEIVDLANCLNKMGAKIEGQGTDTIIINGASSLHYAEHKILPDRIEAGTYAIAAGITNGKVDLIGCDFDQLLPTFSETLTQIGLNIEKIPNGTRVFSNGEISPADINTEPFPGFPTDLQAQTMALLLKAKGTSTIRENIWENRFMHAPEFSRLGASISVKGPVATISGDKPLKGAQVMATDLRASFGLILAALAADGETIIDRVYHLDRGYCNVEEKLAGCGIIIERI